MDYWGQVDWYTGGNEHATRHLLYSRFWHKALKDCGVYLPFDEPYAKRRYQGMILAEGGVKMSKSKGNVINPDEIIEQYGADTLRTYILFIGPFTEDVAWSTTAIMGVHRFLKKAWSLFNKVDMSKSVQMTHADKVITNKTIINVRDRVLNMKFNTAVSALMEFANHMAELEKLPFVMYVEFIKLLSLFAPYICDEIWEKLEQKTFLINEKFSDADEKLLENDTIKIPVSINGKMRVAIEVKLGTNIDELTQIAKSNPSVQKYITGDIKKIIAIENRFINIIL
jgi:leucyl-tRNA synthetase